MNGTTIHRKKDDESVHVKCALDAKMTKYIKENINSPVASLRESVGRLRLLQSRLVMPRIPLG